MVYHKRIKILIIILINITLLCACEKTSNPKHVDMERTEDFSKTKDETGEMDVIEKGYDLPVADDIRKEVEADCKKVMEEIREIYIDADKGEASNVRISEETAYQMLIALQETGCPIVCNGFPYNMVNYEKMERFLKDSKNGRKGEVVIYEVDSSGGVDRRQFVFDGTDMYELGTIATWNKKNEPCITYISYTRIKVWEYTKKGWFSFEYCVPEIPEVSEVVNGNAMIRVKPLQEEYNEIAKKFLIPIGYQGNNLLCSNWSAEHLEGIDYNGLFQYLYVVKNRQGFDLGTYSAGISKEEFEQLFMQYLPITVQQLEQYAVYDKENQNYAWGRLGCINYSPNAFGTSVPEIIDITENKNGTVTLTVDAVCEMLGSDAVMSHKLTVCFSEEGGIRYLENEILGDGLERIPDYQYRFGNR
jgi:hypothetical protein